MAGAMKYSFTVASAAVTWTIPHDQTPDFSRYQNLTLRWQISAMGAGPTLDCKLQCTWDGGTSWDDRIAFTQRQSPLALPATEEGTITQGPVLGGTEELIIPSGSGTADATTLAAGTVRNGPFPPLQGSSATWRIVFTPAGGNAAATGFVVLEPSNRFGSVS